MRGKVKLVDTICCISLFCYSVSKNNSFYLLLFFSDVFHIGYDSFFFLAFFFFFLGCNCSVSNVDEGSYLLRKKIYKKYMHIQLNILLKIMNISQNNVEDLFIFTLRIRERGPFSFFPINKIHLTNVSKTNLIFFKTICFYCGV